MTVPAKQRSAIDPRLSEPDRFFTCTGKGEFGSITELRHGMEASTLFEMEFDVPLRGAWVIPLPKPAEDAYCLLASFPDWSEAVYIGQEAEAKTQSEVPFDLSSRTLQAWVSDQHVIQVTTSSVVVLANDGLYVLQGLFFIQLC